MSNLTKPTIHMNGTSASSLLELYADASATVRVAIDDVAKTGPHGRDYYPQGDEALTKAIEQHRARLQKLEDVLKELEELALHCAEHA